jgi:hypothetical protein
LLAICNLDGEDLKVRIHKTMGGEDFSKLPPEMAESTLVDAATMCATTDPELAEYISYMHNCDKLSASCPDTSNLQAIGSGCPGLDGCALPVSVAISYVANFG